MKSKLISILLCLALMFTILAGCGSTPTTSTPAPDVTPESTDNAGGDPAPVKRTDMTVALSARYPTLDPNEYPTDISRLVIENLVQMNYSTGEIEPGIAESWSTSEDGTVWTLKIREDAYFHNGEQCTADDVIYSVEKIHESSYGFAYDNVTVTKNGDFEVTLEFPEYTNLTMYDVVIPIFCASAFEEMGYDAYFEALIGTGPYVLSEYDTATGTAVLTRNENYWGEPGKLETIKFVIVSDMSAALIALASQNVDFAEIDATVFDSAVADPNLAVSYASPVKAYTMMFNTTVYPTSELKFRQALCYAIDKELIAQVSEVEGNYEITNSFYASVWGEKPEDISSYSYDPDMAKSLLAEIGIDSYDLGTITILSQHKDMMEVIQQNLAEIGITFKLSMVDSVAHRQTMNNGDFIVGITAATDVNVSPVWTFYSYFDGSMCYSGYQSEEMDELSATIYYDTDKEAVENAKAEVMKIATDEALYNIIYLKGSIFAHQNGLVTDMSDNRNRHFENFCWE